MERDIPIFVTLGEPPKRMHCGNLREDIQLHQSCWSRATFPYRTLGIIVVTTILLAHL